ncbi:hypothetical protein ACWCOV_17160 [Kribbella sp. NPDC002412]
MRSPKKLISDRESAIVCTRSSNPKFGPVESIVSAKSADGSRAR